MKIFKYLIIIFFVSLLGAYSFWYQINSSLDKDKTAQIFSVPKGYSIKSIGEKLKNEKIIKSDFYFNIYIRFFKPNANFLAGDYQLGPSFSIRQIVNVLASGKTADRETTIKIIEGWNAKEIDKYLTQNSFIKEGEFVRIANSPLKDYLEKIKTGIRYSFISDVPAGATSEGFLFPDTYKIYKDSTGDDIVQKMFFNFDKKVTTQIKADIIKQKRTLFEIITMASIIEKEVKLDPTGKSNNQDAKIVSGIFWKRIAERRQLESCATLAYILGVNKPQYSLEDTNIDSPYNTYKNFGLPPGPICNPGLEAIKAAVYPEKSNYNFFLNDPESKKTIFSENYDEHLRNKAKYLN